MNDYISACAHQRNDDQAETRWTDYTEHLTIALRSGSAPDCAEAKSAWFRFLNEFIPDPSLRSAIPLPRIGRAPR